MLLISHANQLSISNSTRSSPKDKTIVIFKPLYLGQKPNKSLKPTPASPRGLLLTTGGVGLVRRYTNQKTQPEAIPEKSLLLFQLLSFCVAFLRELFGHDELFPCFVYQLTSERFLIDYSCCPPMNIWS